MKLKGLLITLSLLMCTNAIPAQTAAVAADPISGTWKGHMGASGGDSRRTPITVDLKFDGKSGLTGTVTGPPLPGEIKTGTFNPMTGALKFDVTVAGNANPFVFDGIVFMDTATGRITVGSNSGLFIISKTAADTSTQQPSGGSDASADLRGGFGEVSGYLTKAADLVPADKYTYRPAANVRTFGQLVAHIADSHNYFCARAAGQNVQWSDAIEKGNTDKATLIEKLRQSIGACNAAYAASSSRTGPLIGNIGHTSLHYGNVITYMRMLGLVPPSS